MIVTRIWNADIYRDGGSYGFCFDADDGRWYEFFIKTRAFEDSVEREKETHHPPIIYLEGVNKRTSVQELSWAEGQAFVCSLVYEKKRFHELIEIVKKSGARN